MQWQIGMDGQGAPHRSKLGGGSWLPEEIYLGNGDKLSLKMYL